MRFGKVAVLMGGRAAERSISLESGQAVLDALRRQGIDAHGIDTAQYPLCRLREEGFERAFIALHGRGGEDGVLQGALEALGIPYTGSRVLGSALGMDKLRSKALWRGAGLPTPPFAVLSPPFEGAEALGFPLMVKPAREGSSLGMSKVTSREELDGAYRKALSLDPLVFGERFIEGQEYTAAILHGRALPLIRLEPQAPFFDFEAKYGGKTRYHCPAGLPPEKERAVAALALEAFEALGASGWGRVDLIIDARGQPWLLEINTVPGMTPKSLVPMAARAAGMDFDALVRAILETSLW